MGRTSRRTVMARFIRVFFIIVQCGEILGQVCVETVMSYRDVPETYSYTYMEAYEMDDCWVFCSSTRVATATGTKIVQKLMPEQINVCCEGYVEEEADDHNGTSIHCQPLCSSGCINGYCKSPEVCACNPGYVPDIFDVTNCIPLCLNGCDHGTCIAPNTCHCDDGFELVTGEFNPVCSDPCENGYCVAPDTCQCYPGFEKTENSTCEPYCSSYTESGECTDTITCEPGWTKVYKDKFEICEPICSNMCINGICIAPETCECLDGYEKSDRYVCEPHCSIECVHGICVSPERCVCDPGWYLKEARGECLPHCDYSCGNGTCVAPNICECFLGYKVDESSDVPDSGKCIPKCNNCDGSCIAPGLCICEPPLESVPVTTDGLPCDCSDNCSDDANKCERTICKIATTTPSFVNPVTFDKDVEETTVHETANEEVKVTDSADVSDVEQEIRLNYDNINYEYSNISETSWLKSKWFYAAGILLLAVILLTIIAVLKRNKIIHVFNRNIADNGVLAAVHYKQKNCP